MSSANPSSNNLPVIDMDRVSCSAMRDRHMIVAEEVNWRVQAGEFWVLAGLQGAGKTDFLMLLAGLMPPVSGRYLFLGESMPIFEAERLKHRLKLGLVFDGGQLLNQLTVLDNVALPLRYHENLSLEQAKERVRPMLERMELSKLASRTPGSLGRNWQKRVGLARALILAPEVLLIDNPLGALDPRHTWWWLDFLGRFWRGEVFPAQRPPTMILAVPDLRPWRHRAQKFALLREKRLVQLGSWAEVESADDVLVRELSEEPRGGDIDEAGRKME